MFCVGHPARNATPGIAPNLSPGQWYNGGLSLDRELGLLFLLVEHRVFPLTPIPSGEMVYTCTLILLLPFLLPLYQERKFVFLTTVCWRLTCRAVSPVL